MQNRVLLILLACLYSHFGYCSDTSNKKPEILCHYMTWFGFRKENDKQVITHWKWNKKVKHDPTQSLNGETRDIYSVLYPRIGIYDSLDPLVIQYHILAAKSCGVSSFVCDWYGEGSPSDKAFLKLIQLVPEYNFTASICYEDKLCFPPWAKIKSRKEAVSKAIADFTYMQKNYLARKEYWIKKNKPVVFVFGAEGETAGIGPHKFTSEEWRHIVKSAGVSAYIVPQRFWGTWVSGKDFFKASFGWGRHNMERFYKRCDKYVKSGILEFYTGCASPGFDSTGTWQWGTKPRFDAFLGTEKLDYYLNLFDNSGCDTMQLVTWNDYAEGTCIEPTAQFGSLFTDRIAWWASGKGIVPYYPGAAKLAYQWFYLAKKLEANQKEVAAIHKLLNSREYYKAESAINELCLKQKLEIPAYINIENEFPMHQNQ